MRRRPPCFVPIEVPHAFLSYKARAQMNSAMDRFLRIRGLLVGQEAFRAEMKAGFTAKDAKDAKHVGVGL